MMEGRVGAVMTELPNKEKKKKPFGLHNRYLLLAIAIICFSFIVLFAYVPLFGWSMAFFDYKPGFRIMDCKFTGLDSFKQLISHPDFPVVMRNTFAMSFLGLLTMPIPMLLAIFLNEIRNKRVRSAVQTLTTLPYFIGWILVFSIAFAIFAPGDGMINRLIRAINPTAKPFDPMGNPNATWMFQLCLGLWKGTGFSAIVYLASLAGIDQELFDAAHVDGVSRWNTIRYITIPSLIPTFLTLFLLGIGNILNNGFDQYYMFQNNLNKSTIQVLDLFQYNVTMLSSTPGGNYPLSTAIAMSKTVVSVTLLFVANAISKKLRGTAII